MSWHTLEMGNMRIHGLVKPVPAEYKDRTSMVQFVFKYANYLVPAHLLIESPDYKNEQLHEELTRFPVRSGIIIYNPELK